jgi:peptidyl-prolyl cis-trans isomerase A (cyclophilin A)
VRANQTRTSPPRSDLIKHPQLFGYTVFGKVVSGMDTVQKIRNTPTGSGGPFPTDVPQKQVLIESASLVNYPIFLNSPLFSREFAYFQRVSA